MTGKFSSAAGIKPGGFAAAAGLEDPARLAQGGASNIDLNVYERARAKTLAGQPLTREEAQAYAAARASGKNLTLVGEALQPFFVLSDLTKGLIGEAQGTGGSLARGGKAAAGHLTYGLTEYLPGLGAARTQGVTGMELLKGTKYEGNTTAALAVEIFADPSVLLTGAGLVAKAGSTAGRLAQLEKLARTPEQAATIRGALLAVNEKGSALLRAGDEVTGVPAAIRGAAKTKAAQAAKGKFAAAMDTQLPNFPGSRYVRDEGGGTVGDAFLTPDGKKTLYTPEQLARDEFRTGVRLDVDELASGIKRAANADADVVSALYKGLKQADAAEANRLLGVFTTTTKPEVAAEALRKLTNLGADAGTDLVPRFVDAVKATDRIGQQTLGAELAARNLPAIIDPVVTKAVQDAQSGADLVAQVGKYTNAEGRPRGILMTQYTGRSNPAKVIQALNDAPATPAAVTIEPQQVAASLERAPVLEPLPPRPIEPVAVPAKGQPPLNPQTAAARVTGTPVNVTPPFAQGAARQGLTEARTPQQVMADLFGGRGTPASSKSVIPFEPQKFDGAETVYRGEVTPGEYAGLDLNMNNTKAMMDFTNGARGRRAAYEEEVARIQRAATELPEKIATKEAQLSKAIDEGGEYGPGVIDLKGDLAGLRYSLAENPRRLSAAQAQITGLDKLEAAEAAHIATTKAHSDMVYASPDRTVAEAYAADTDGLPGVIRELKIAPQKTVDLRPLSPKGKITSVHAAERILKELGVSDEAAPGILKAWGVTPEWESRLFADGALRQTDPRNVYELFRGSRADVIKPLLKEQGVDAVRYGEGLQDNVVVIGRGNAAEVLPGGTLRPTSPDVKPMNAARTPAAVLDDLLGSAAARQAPAPRNGTEFDGWAAAQHARAGGLTDAEAAQVVGYGGKDFRVVNERLRGLGPEDEAAMLGGASPEFVRGVDEQVAGMRATMQRYPLAEPATLYRGLPPNSATATRIKAGLADGSLKPGDRLSQESFASTSLMPEGAAPFHRGDGLLLEIDAPAGTRAIPLGGRSGLGSEAEVLLDAGYDLTIKSFSKPDARGLVTVRAAIDAPGPPAGLLERFNENGATAARTPREVMDSILNPAPVTDIVSALPAAGLRPTAQSVLKDVGLPAAAPERLVERAVPTTYRTVEIDANGLGWGALPDDAARRSVLNSIEGAGNARFIPDASGATRLDRSSLRVPLDHPVVGRYFGDDELMFAQRTGTEIGERTITRRELVPDWYNPRSGLSLTDARSQHNQAVREAQEAAFPNDAGYIQTLHAVADDTGWVIGDAYASYERLVKPDLINTRAASNNYAQRVAALTGSPPTRGEVFQYRLQLARYRQAVNLRQIKGGDVAQHLQDFYRASPEATLYEGVLSAARAFDLGRPGAKHMQTVLREAESGFMRQLSSLEKKEFAGYLMGKDGMNRGGGGLMGRLTRKPQTVSEEFQQVFALDVNALKVLDDQVRTRTAAIVRAEGFKRYHDYLEGSGALITRKKLDQLKLIPPHRLTAEQRTMREAAASAIDAPGTAAGWKVMDRNVEGYFEKGDVVPWWAYFDLFGARSVEDAAVSAGILSRTYDRAWSAMNARMLGTPSSILNDQVGHMLQMGMWGVTPDAVIEGMIRRATAKPAELEAMRKSGIQSAKLEANIGADREVLSRLAARLDGDTDMTRMERVVDRVLRFAERGTGIDPQAMTGAAGVAADAANFGSGYLFRVRSAMSDLQRESLYFHRTALGDTSAQAARYANDVLLDMRLVPAYARVIRRGWPFFNWIAMSGPRSIVTVLRKPGVNAAYQRAVAATDNPDDKRDPARRLLARDGGYINIHRNERSGARLYLDPRNWDPTNTLPQLMDWSGTKVGAVGLPWYVNLVTTIQWGQDRFGRNIYDQVLDGATGGFTEAYRVDRKQTMQVAAKAFVAQFNPSYAPGSPRAQAFVRATLATAQLPEDGSKDIVLAKTLAETGAGRAYLLYLQSGNFAGWADKDLLGTRESPYSDAAPSMARAAGNFLAPVRAVNADQNQQGTAMQALSVGKLQFQTWLAGEKKRLAAMEAGGATPERIRAEEDRIEREAAKRAGKRELIDSVTR